MCNHSAVKLHELYQLFAMVNDLREITESKCPVSLAIIDRLSICSYCSTI